MTAKILIVDDNITTCNVLKQMIEKLGHDADTCHSLRDGLGKIFAAHIDIVFLDVNMPDGDGLETLKEIQKIKNCPEVIIITGDGDRNGAEIAIRNGAWDYLQKPLSPKEILPSVKRVLEYREKTNPTTSTLTSFQRSNIIGNSKPLLETLEKLARAARNNSNVLLTGETGTGKEIFARALHNNSQRADKRLIVVDCTAIPETLIENTLFGHAKGAFTGADRSAVGLVKLADKGSLFLDEVGDLDIIMQKRLLRILQERRFRPVGSTTEEESDFRLISATNRDLESMVEQGTFREDLYFRIRTQSIELPPLRERHEDIELLASYYIKKICAGSKLPHKDMSNEFINSLKSYSWPGNVRELVHVIEETIHSTGSKTELFAKDLPQHVRIHIAQNSIRSPTQKVPAEASASISMVPADLPPYREYKKSRVDQIERMYLEQLAKISAGDVKKACTISKIGRAQLYNLLKKHGVKLL